MPYIVLETLAAGKPLIATNVGGIPEIFGISSDGITEPGVQAIETHMIKVLNDEARWSALMPDKATLKSRFGADIMAAAIETAYFAALEHRNGLPQTQIS
jgi:glycosyltransferase involved in cell wall biosynthesis